MRLTGVVLALTLTLAPLTVEAQPQSGKVYKVGVIVSTGSAADVSGPNPRHQNVTALLRGLRELVQ